MTRVDFRDFRLARNRFTIGIALPTAKGTRRI